MKKIILPLLAVIILSGCSSVKINSQKPVVIDTSSNKEVKKEDNSNISTSSESKLESDGEMVLSSDKKYGVFLVSGEGIKDEVAETTSYYNEIWMFDFATKNKSLLVKSGDIKDLKIANVNKDNFPFSEIHDLILGEFSNDGKYFYFASYAWSTSYAVFSININSKEIKLITDSNYLEVIKAGKYKDMLLTMHHRYYDGGGTYDYYYITDPKNGKDVKNLGENKNKALELVGASLIYNIILKSKLGLSNGIDIYYSRFDNELIKWKAKISAYYDQLDGIKFCVVDEDHKNIDIDKPCDWFWATSGDILGANDITLNPKWDGHWVNYTLNYYKVKFNENERFYNDVYTVTGIVNHIDCGVDDKCVPNIEIVNIEK